LGGLLYDLWGFQTVLWIAILFAGASLLIALKTLPASNKKDAILKGAATTKTAVKPAFNKPVLTPASSRSVIVPTTSFFFLLWVSFVVMLAWSFIEPLFMIHVSQGLSWNASSVGLVMSAYGVALTLGEFSLGHLGDRWGRKRVILLGLFLFSAQFFGLALLTRHFPIAVSFLVAGFGNALFDPALNAAFLDLAPAHQQSRYLGFRSTAASLGSILGPGLVVLFSAALQAQVVFLASAGLVIFTAVVGLFVKFKKDQLVKPAPKNT